MSARVLIGDLGGTNLRLALTDGDGLRSECVFKTAELAGLEAALEAFLEPIPAPERPKSAIVAVAGPVSGDRIRLTNCPWQFSRDAVRERFGWARFGLMNDFAAVAAALPHFADDHLDAVQTGIEVARRPKLVLGPGTGLGVGVAVPSGEDWHVLDGEGGHATLAASNGEEAELIALLRRRLGHVSAEDVLSGPGLVNIFAAIAERDGLDLDPATGEEVVERLDKEGCPAAQEALDRFACFLGTVAGNAALTAGARGGVYLAGGVLQNLGARFRADLFRAAFNAKGRMSAYLETVPVYRITHPEPGLFGLQALARG
ncbi:glucokinase [Nisaea sp.]|uniref:glucokinase n=1 Tax=Nisaea sp. TaxID=2024842 RepID=UPI003B5302FD